VFKEIALFTELCHKVDEVLIQEYFVKTDYVWMVHFHQHLNLSLQILQLIVIQVVSQYRFQSEFLLVIRLLRNESYYAKFSLANLLANEVQTGYVLLADHL
jgi:hypothetical protein